jgi:hypothetical protein
MEQTAKEKVMRRFSDCDLDPKRQEVGPMAERGSRGSNKRTARKGIRVARGIAPMIVAGVMALAPALTGALAQDQTKPVLSVAAVIQVRPDGGTALPIRVGPANLIPRQAFLRIRGLPPTAALSEGHSIGPGTWAVPLTALPRLRIEVPAGTEGKSEIAILLVSVDGTVLHDARSTLVIAPREPPPAPVPSGPRASALRIQPDGPPVPLDKGVAEKGPQISPEERDRASKLLQRGNELIANKDFSAAQHFYKRAAEMGLAEAAVALARTYDPGELSRIGAVGLRANPEMARNWYEKARALGSAEADGYLLRLSAVR